MSEGKMPQVLHIEPARELIFTGPFTDVVNSTLTLTNPSDKFVCFKVKTTAPKQYCVRPNSGVILPHANKLITVMLQPLEGANNADIARHKFMVQTCYAPSADIDLEKIWKDTDPNNLMYSKLMVVFENPRNNSTSQFAREEAPAAIQYSSPSASIPSSKASSDAGRGSDFDVQLRNEAETRKKLENEKTLLAKEIQELYKKNAELQQRTNRGNMEVGVPTIQVILATIAALLLGLIIGRLF